MATETEQLVVSLEARMNQFEKAFARATQTATRSFDGIESRAKQSADRLERSLTTSTTAINRALGTIGAGITFGEITRYADAWTEASNRIRAAAAATAVQVRSLQELKAGANDARTSLEDYVNLYARLIRSAGGIAKSEADIARATNITAKAFKAGGASASEQASGILQLAQALGSGRLQGDELRSITENAPILAKAIADAFKVPVGALKSLGEQGKITSEKVFEAILKAGPEVERQFRATTATIGDSFTRLKNDFTAYVGTIAQSSGVAAAFRNVIEGLAGNIASVTQAAAAAAAVLLSAYVPAMLRATAAGAAMIATNPFLLLATAAGAAVFAVSAFGDRIQPIQGDLATLQDYASASWDLIKEGASTAASAIQDAFHTVVTFTGNALSSIGLSWADVGSVVKGVANTVMNAFVFAYEVLVATFGRLPGAIAETVLSAINGLISTVEAGLNAVVAGVNKAVAAINAVGGKVGVALGTIGDVALGRIENSYKGAGQLAGEAYFDALSGITRDRVGEALSGINSMGGASLADLRRRAEEIARQRLKEAADAKRAADAAKTAPTRPAATMPLEMTKEADELRKRIGALQAEVAIRKSVAGSIEEVEATLERQRIAQKLVNEAAKEGVKFTDDVKAAVGALADAYAKAAQEAKALAKSQEEATQKAKDLEGATKDGIKGFVSDLARGKSATDALKSAIDRVSTKLFDMAVDQVWKNAFGKDGQAFKPFTDALFPSKPDVVKAQGSPIQGVDFDPNKTTTTPQMNVAATNVTVTGSINAPGLTATPGAAAPGTAPAVTPAIPSTTPTPAAPVPVQLIAPNASTGSGASAAGSFSLNASGGKMLSLSEKDITDLKKTLMTEWVTSQGDMQGKGIIDTILNRRASGRWGDDIASVVNARKQFSDINGPPAWAKGRNSVDQLSTDDRRYAQSSRLVDEYLPQRAAGTPSAVGDNLNYANRAASTPNNWGWIDALRGPKLGAHQHGTTPDLDRYRPGDYSVKLPGRDPDTTGSISDMQKAQQEAQEEMRRAAEATRQATQETSQQLQSMSTAATQAVPNLSGMSAGLTGLIGPLTKAVPGLGQFGGAISMLLQSLMSGMGGGGAGLGGLLGGVTKLFGFAEGGAIRGPGTSTSDSIPIMASDGEFMVNAKATKRYAPFLEAINAGKVPAFALGGSIGATNFTRANTYAPSISVSVSGGNQQAKLAQEIASRVGSTLGRSRPDSFRRTEGQMVTEAGLRMAGYAGRNA